MTGTNIYATITINTGSNIVLNGLLNSMTGSHIFYYTSDGSTYPTRQDLHLGHDNTNITFDQYYDGSNWRASSTTASYAINKTGGNLQFRYAPATGANNQISTPVSFLINSSGQIQIQTNTDSSSINTGALTVSGGVGISKKLYVGDSLYLPTSGGSASALNYYEEGTSTLTLNGLWASNPTVTASWCRVGSLVFIQTQAAAISSTNASGSSFNITGFPSRLYPSRIAYFYFPLIATQGGTTINTSWKHQ